MTRYAQFVVRRPRVILGLVALVSVLAATQIPGLGYDDDVVRFLPAEDPEVQAFSRITERFGALEVALVAVEAPPDETLFSWSQLDYLRRLSRRLAELPEVAHLTSISELAIVDGSDGTGSHISLVPQDEVPRDPDALDAIKDRILGLDYLTGLLVSKDGTAAVLIAQLRKELPDGEAISIKRAAEVTKEAALGVKKPEDVRLHFGGAPFIAEAAANGSQDDLARLAPFVVGITLLLVILSLGSFFAALYTILAVALAILWTIGLMGALGEPLTLVSTSLPVILAALGSAYTVHLLVWYREHGGDLEDAVGRMGPPIVVTALTTMAGFGSFLVMDLSPMREFGWQMAAGTAIAAVLALTFVPAMLGLNPIPARSSVETRVDRWLVDLARTCARWRWPILLTAGGMAVLLATQLGRIDTRMDTAAFFEEGSAPARADALLADKFGGSVFLQVLVDGDIRDPAVLHRIAAFEDRLSAVPGVTRVESIAGVLAIVHEGMKSDRRLSRQRDEIEQHGFLAAKSDPAVALLVDEDWRGALIQVGLGAFDTATVERATPAVRELAARTLEGDVTVVDRSDEAAPTVLADAAERIAALARVPARFPEIQAALSAAMPAETRRQVAEAIGEVIETEIVEDEMVELAVPESAAKLEKDIADIALSLRLDRERFDAELRRYVTAEELTDVEGFSRTSEYLFTKVELAAAPLLRAHLVKALLTATGPLDERRAHRVAAIANELLQPQWYLGAPAGDGGPAIRVTVSGQPVIQQAMTESVQRNQVNSLATSLPLVLLILVFVFRSVVAALIGLLPAAGTLLATFGLMGLFPEELPMDLAASMLASIALGVGIDYAIHFLWRYQRGDLEKAMRTTGRSIAINALEITGGFVVLAWASIAPISRFGLLIAETLLVAAVATLVLLPALLTWWNPRRLTDNRHEPLES